jgi:capsid protein
MLYGASPGLAYPNSRMTAATADWPVWGTDPKDDFWRESGSIANRSWHLWRNNPYARALVRTMVEGTIGPNGLRPRSIFRGTMGLDPVNAGVEATAEAAGIQATRAAIEKSLRNAWRGRRFDATGQMTKRDMSEQMLVSCIVSGDAFAIRQWKPNRPGRQYQATCWRIIDPARVSNPSFGPNSATRFEGIELDSDGCPIGLHVQRRSPFAVQVVDWTWQYIPWYAADGTPNVVHLRSPGRADSIRGVGWFDAIMGLVHHLGQVTEAYVIAKRLQACIGLIEVAPPGATPGGIANGQTAGAQSASPTGATIGKLYPGMRVVVPNGTDIKALNWNFNGDDNAAFQDSMLQAICAAWGLPMEYVQHRLTKSNLASARAALMQAYRTFHCAQEMLIAGAENPWAESVILEDLARGRLDIAVDADGDLIDDLTELRWNRPAKPFPDPLKEQLAATEAMANGKSPSSIFASAGDDFESEILQSSQDYAFAKLHGVEIQRPTVPPPSEGSLHAQRDGQDGQADGKDDADDGEEPQATGSTAANDQGASA